MCLPKSSAMNRIWHKSILKRNTPSLNSEIFLLQDWIKPPKNKKKTIGSTILPQLAGAIEYTDTIFAKR